MRYNEKNVIRRHNSMKGKIKKIITVFLIAGIICESFSMTASAGTSANVTTVFSDVYDDWYTESVQYVYDKGLMTGFKGTTLFRPEGNINKAQVAQVLYNMEGQPKVTDRKVFGALKDVYDYEWYADAVAWAYNTGVITGDLNTKKFYPKDNVTREQLALMMYRYADYKWYDIGATSNVSPYKYLDAHKISNWTETAMNWAVEKQFIRGFQTDLGFWKINPQGTATRREMATILKRFCEYNGL